MKGVVIVLILALVFLIGFVTRIETKILGPSSAAEKDDLEIQEVYWDHSDNALVLIARAQWAKVSLVEIVKTNRQLRICAPRNSHWKSFVTGRPIADQLLRMEPVKVACDQYASFAYYHYPPDGQPRRNSEELVTVPDGYQAALYRSSAEVGPDNRRWFKSYILATRVRQPDGLFGIQFFYDPDFSRSVVFRPPYGLGIFGLSFLGLCIALPVALGDLRGGMTGFGFVAAFVLHAGSSLLYFLVVAYGEAWSGYGPEHNGPRAFFSYGCGILLALMCLKKARTMMARIQGNNIFPPQKCPTTAYEY